MGKDSPYRMPLASREEDPALAALLAEIPYKARRAALAAGLEPLLSRLLREKSQQKEPIPQLALEEELTLRVVAFDAQLSAASFEAGCTANMLQKEVGELGHLEQSRQLSIAIASLVVGAAGSTAAGVWTLQDQDSKGPTVLGIAAGVTTAVLGAAALVHEESSIWFAHPRNRLTPVWRGQDPDHLYPTFVFRMLSFADESDGQSPREELIAAWQAKIDDTLPSVDREHAIELLLGEGGKYDETLLSLRAEMFQTLEAAVQGVARDLELLNRYLVRALTTPPSDPTIVAPKL